MLLINHDFILAFYVIEYDFGSNSGNRFLAGGIYVKQYNLVGKRQ